MWWNKNKVKINLINFRKKNPDLNLLINPNTNSFPNNNYSETFKIRQESEPIKLIGKKRRKILDILDMSFIEKEAENKGIHSFKF